LLFRNVSFTLIFKEIPPSNCNSINTINEGVEFSIHRSSSPDWIPLSFAYFKNGTSSNNYSISLGDIMEKGLRGYVLPDNRIFSNQSIIQQTLLVCGINKAESFQFRWLQTSKFNNEVSKNFKDTWILDDIKIELVSGNSQHRLTLINESFSNMEYDPMR